ncbi:hypothetical protein BGZ73_001261, partial [Actinomortierella ambigua]
ALSPTQRLPASTRPSQLSPDLPLLEDGWQQDPSLYTFKPGTSSNHLTVKEAWEEFHSLINAAKRRDLKWPFSKAGQRTYQRRSQFIKLIKMKIERENLEVETFLESFSTLHKGKTVNKIPNLLREEAKSLGVQGAEIRNDLE